MASEMPRVALLIETSLYVGRGILAGVSHYIKKHEPWAVYAFPHGLDQPPPQWFDRWQGDGIIARIQNQSIADAVASKNVPVVDVLGVCSVPNSALVHVDDPAIAEMAADHLIDNGFREFAYFGLAKENWSLARELAFKERVTSTGGSCETMLLSRQVMENTDWVIQVEQVADWIKTLPQPVGIMLCSDVEGLLVQEACRAAGRVIGRDIGLVGVGNDRTLCELSHPPLSSVDVDIESVGYQAAALLDSLIAGAPMPKEPNFIKPSYVMARKSSDFVAVDDPLLARALEYISEHYAEPIELEDIAKNAGFSRSVLQRRFRDHLNHSVFDHVTSVRIRRAIDLLQTDLAIDEIAELSGFSYAQTMGRVFRRKLGKSPKHYRRWDR